MRFIIIVSCLLLTLSFSSSPSIAQPVQSGTRYKSHIDQSLTIKRVTVLPATDNLNGIYSRPFEDYLIQLVDANHQWEYIKSHSIGRILTLSEFEESQSETQKLAQQMGVDAFLIGRVIKGPNGIRISLALFLASDGLLFSKQEVKNIKKFDLNEMKSQTQLLLKKIQEQIPYNGMILSRQGTQVTLNLGSLDGVKTGQKLSIVQILAVTRHPKFHFLINTEKEILGQVQLAKVDNTLSFGLITSEIEKGAIQKESKVAGLKFQTYSNSPSPYEQNSGVSAASQKSNPFHFGKNPQEWLPQKPPTFGQVSALIGIGNYQYTLSQSSPLEAKASIYPNIQLSGELWLTPEFTLYAQIKQGIISFSNPTGGNPSQLTGALSSYDFSFGYNIRMGGVFGSFFEGLIGFASHKLSVDDSTNGLTTATYGGLKLAIGGAFPVTLDKSWHAGARLHIFISPKLSESPGSSGSSSSSTANKFTLYAKKRIRANMQLLGSLDIELFSSQLSGTGTRSVPATSASHKNTSLGGDIIYLF